MGRSGGDAPGPLRPRPPASVGGGTPEPEIVRTDYFVTRCFIAVGLRSPCCGVAEKVEGAGADPERNETPCLRCTEMLCEITVGPSYLKADLFNRQTAEEARDALAAIAAEARKHACSQILISVHASRPLFKVEQYGLPDYFKGLGEIMKCRIALTGDSDELRLSQQYIELLARRNGVNVRSFPNEEAALSWFRDRRWSLDRRLRQEPLEGQGRSQHPPRRHPGSGRLGSAGRNSA